MKRVIISTLFLISISLSMQAQNKFNFLFDGSESSHSGFGSMIIAIGNIKGETTTLLGGGGGGIINQQFFYGGYGMGQVGNVETQLASGEVIGHQIRHGGLWLGMILMPRKVVHLSVSVKYGWGNIKQELVSLHEEPSPLELKDKVQVFTPELMLQVNLFPWFRLEAGASYQSVLGVAENDYYSSEDVSQPMGRINLSFGWFSE